MYGSFIDDWKTPDEYISRKAVMEMLENAQIISDGENCGYCTEDISISSIPAAEVAPVVHAKWKSVYGTHRPRVACTNCKYDVKSQLKYYKRCPNCCAKMDVGK